MITSPNLTKHPDFIGDIHGHFDALELLFKKLGYEKTNGVYKHPDRIPIFIGDYIDRGPKIKEVLHLVRKMQENESAYAIMGNHEYNYLCYHHCDESGNPFRENSSKNEKQLALTDVALKDISERKSYLDWMASLPIAIETDSFRAIHAQWNNDSINSFKNSQIKKLDQEGLTKLHQDNLLLKNVDVLLKGLEIALPIKLHYKDHGDHERKEARVKWWISSNGKKFGDTFASLPEESMDIDISEYNFESIEFYNPDEKPVFFGHYCLQPSEFGLTSTNTCCVDFNIAKNGLLAAYRFSGEQLLELKNLKKHI